MKKLPKLVEATRMLVCAEDLGMVPDCVAWVMKQLRILSLEIQSMPKDPQVRFGVLTANPYRSVCTISSHDMPTLRQWWARKTTTTPCSREAARLPIRCPDGSHATSWHNTWHRPPCSAS